MDKEYCTICGSLLDEEGKCTAPPEVECIYNLLMEFDGAPDITPEE